LRHIIVHDAHRGQILSLFPARRLDA